MRRHGESRAHEKQKERIGAVIRKYGWSVYVDDYPLECKTEKGERTYWPDIYTQNFSLYNSRRACPVLQGSGRRTILEIQGPKGHNTKLARTSDDLRIEDIRNAYGDIEYFEVFLNKRKSYNDIRNWTEQDIVDELSL